MEACEYKGDDSRSPHILYALPRCLYTPTHPAYSLLGFRGPKQLSFPPTPLFQKGGQIYGYTPGLKEYRSGLPAGTFIPPAPFSKGGAKYPSGGLSPPRFFPKGAKECEEQCHQFACSPRVRESSDTTRT